MNKFIKMRKLCFSIMTFCMSGLIIAGCGDKKGEAQTVDTEVALLSESETEETIVEEVSSEEVSSEEVPSEEASLEEITAEFETTLREYTGAEIVDILVEDFENKGEYSAFVVTCPNFSKDAVEGEDSEGMVFPSSLWFFNGETCTLLEENLQYFAFSLQCTCCSDGKKPVMFNTWLSNSSHMGTIYLVEEGNPKRLGEFENPEWIDDCIVEAKLVRKDTGEEYAIMGEEKTSYIIENGEFVATDTWFEQY